MTDSLERRRVPATIDKRSLNDLNDLSPLNSINQKLADAVNPDEAQEWLRIREQAIDQEARLKAQAEGRFYRKASFVLQLLFAIACISIGIYLIQTGTWLAGFFILGAGLYVFVADYVRMFFREVWRG